MSNIFVINGVQIHISGRRSWSAVAYNDELEARGCLAALEHEIPHLKQLITATWVALRAANGRRKNSELMSVFAQLQAQHAKLSKLDPHMQCAPFDVIVRYMTEDDWDQITLLGFDPTFVIDHKLDEIELKYWQAGHQP